MCKQQRRSLGGAMVCLVKRRRQGRNEGTGKQGISPHHMTAQAPIYFLRAVCARNVQCMRSSVSFCRVLPGNTVKSTPVLMGNASDSDLQRPMQGQPIADFHGNLPVVLTHLFRNHPKTYQKRRSSNVFFECANFRKPNGRFVKVRQFLTHRLPSFARHKLNWHLHHLSVRLFVRQGRPSP